MPSVDMPLEKLKQYQGMTPRPDDFNAYWERALKQMHAIDSDINLEAADFQVPFAECNHLYFSGTGGSRVHAKYLKPKTSRTEKHPAVLIFHGYTGRSPEWSSLLNWVAAGYSVFAMDSRGQGGLSNNTEAVTGTTWSGHIIRGLSDGPDKLLFRNIFLDTAQLARIAMGMDEVDADRVGCLGGSQGGALTLACASLEPRIKKAAPTYPFLCDYKRVWQMDLGENAYKELFYYFRAFDPTHEREDEIFRTLGYIDLQNMVPWIKAEVLMATGLIDEICPASTQFAAYNKITSKKEVVIYPDFGHENLPGFDSRVYRFMMGL